MNTLGIDYGAKQVGLAVSSRGLMALGFATIANRGRKDLLRQISNIVVAHEIDQIVVGIPVTRVHGKKQTQEIIRFREDLETALPNIRIFGHNETMTSMQASRVASADKEHQEAARIILDDWLAYGGDGLPFSEKRV